MEYKLNEKQLLSLIVMSIDSLDQSEIDEIGFSALKGAIEFISKYENIENEEIMKSFVSVLSKLQ